MSTINSEKVVFNFLKNKFYRIYGDLVILTGNKPQEVLLQFEDVISHLCTANLSKSEKVKQQNWGKALGHLQRATLDVSKLLWLETKRKIDFVYSDDDIKKFCLNCSDVKFTKLYTKGVTLAQKARKLELDNVGLDPTESIEAYYQAINSMQLASQQVDDGKLASFRRFKFWYKGKEYLIGFVIGFFSSIAASYFSESFRNAIQPSKVTPSKN
jgi:hypothetical protein